MRVEGDTIYYADAQSTPIAFKIMRDILYTYGNDTTYYKIDKQGEHIFWFHSITDNVIKLHKSEDLNDSIYFVRKKRDSVVTYNGTRYRAYVYINPSKMRVIKTTYSEDGISMDNVYYDNVMHICVYEGKKSLFASDITKQMFDKVVPADFLAQSILSDTKFVKVNRNGFHYQAVLAIPETSIYSVVNMEVSFKGDLEIIWRLLHPNKDSTFYSNRNQVSQNKKYRFYPNKELQILFLPGCRVVAFLPSVVSFSPEIFSFREIPVPVFVERTRFVFRSLSHSLRS